MMALYEVPAGTKLDLGSGPRPAEGYHGVDIEPGVSEFVVDFESGLPWPFRDGSIEALRASHVIEHIASAHEPEWEKLGPDGQHELGMDRVERGGWCWGRTYRRKDLLFHFFDEAFRVIKPGGEFEVRWPNVQHVNASGDPTHRRFISPLLIRYLSREGRQALGVEWYRASCNWTGTVFATTNSATLLELEQEELGARNNREWNLCEELVMLLTAEKEA